MSNKLGALEARCRELAPRQQSTSAPRQWERKQSVQRFNKPPTPRTYLPMTKLHSPNISPAFRQLTPSGDVTYNVRAPSGALIAFR